MNILIDINHPAQVHLLKNLIKYLVAKDHNVIITVRDKDVSTSLLDNYNFSYIALTSMKSGFINQIIELFIKDFKTIKLNLQNKFDIGIGTSYSIPHLSLFSSMKSYFVNEDDDFLSFFNDYCVQPFATKIINPDCLRFTKWKDKRVLHNSYHELAYLHPNNFTPDETILKKYNLEKKKYVILRLNSLKAHHDVGAKGISPKLYEKIKNLLKGYTIIESKENAKTHQIEPWDMHHVLAFSKMIVSDSQTMTIEASVLGVPAVRINTFVGKSTVIDELEQRYKLAYGYFPNQVNESLNTIEYLISNDEVGSLWQERREFMLSEKCDLNQWMIDYFEKEMGDN